MQPTKAEAEYFGIYASRIYNTLLGYKFVYLPDAEIPTTSKENNTNSNDAI